MEKSDMEKHINGKLKEWYNKNRKFNYFELAKMISIMEDNDEFGTNNKKITEIELDAIANTIITILNAIKNGYLEAEYINEVKT